MDDLVTRLNKAGAQASHTHELRGLLTDCLLAAAEIERLRTAHQDIIHMYEKMMGPPPDWTKFTGDQITWVREAWYGAANISRKAIGDEQQASWSK